MLRGGKVLLVDTTGAPILVAAGDTLDPVGVAARVLAALYAYDGANPRRLVADAGGRLNVTLYDSSGRGIRSTTNGQLAVAISGTPGDGLANVHADLNTDSIGNSYPQRVLPYSFNGSTWDRRYGLTEGVLLADSARTASTASATQINYAGARGVILSLYFDIFSGTGSLQPVVEYLSPITAGWNQLHATAPATVAAAGQYTYLFYPESALDAPNGNMKSALPRSWRARVIHGDASSQTYGLGYSYVM